MERRGILVAGTVLVDKINEITAYPAEGELTQIIGLQMSSGGNVPNVGIDLKKLAPSLPVYALGKVGDDAEGHFLKDTLDAAGLDTQHLTMHSGLHTSFTEVMSVPGRQRTFFTYAGADATLCANDVDFTRIPSKILHLAYFLLLKAIDEGEGLKILKNATACGVETSMDLVSENSNRYRQVLPCLPYVDYLTINELEAAKLTGMAPAVGNLKAMAQALLALGVRKRVVIHMPDCAVSCTASGCAIVPSLALPAEYIKGTTGAGDAFCAGVLLGTYEGKTDTELLEFASECAALALSAPDATGGLCRADEVHRRCQAFERRTLSL